MRCIHLEYKFLLQHNTCRDQMNSGRGWELGPRAQSWKWSVMDSFSEMPTEHPGELAPGGYAVGQNDVTLWKVSPLVDQFIRGIETLREWKRKMDETNQILFAPGEAGKRNNNQNLYCFKKNFFQRIFFFDVDHFLKDSFIFLELFILYWGRAD